MAEYIAVVRWRRGDGDFAANEYSRAHEWAFDGGTVVPASASPHIVPPPHSVPANVDPEEAFVAALSSCHMLFFLSIAARRRFVVDAYEDRATGVLQPDERGRLAMTRVTLRPAATFSGERTPSREELERLHEMAHEQCFIANSVRTEVVTEIVFPEALASS